MLSGCAITWKSKKQSTVALSSTEAEYMALGDTVKELLWLVQLVQNIGLKFKNPPTVFEEMKAANYYPIILFTIKEPNILIFVIISLESI